MLKGGMLVAALVGLNARSTMDIDTTCKGYPLTLESAREMVEEIAALDIGDGMTFDITGVSEIMEDSEYGGVRISLVSHLDKTRTNLKIDISTGDAITPSEISYDYKLMLEDRCLNIWTYSLETILAEKLQTILIRSVYNTRPRDFYDIYVLQETNHHPDPKIFDVAMERTCAKRNTLGLLTDADLVLSTIEASRPMRAHWGRFQNDYDYAQGIEWEDAVSSVRLLVSIIR
ncbi:MAG TPA: nucleotidyl transferase AbiEii/AbiGii toxin family protein [Candidatus Gordonibacter avicola]|nr:nucleotidyl transferase AbiEii/AbiGii toxin family protein [Candidatus Gordonibacter avicola]